MKTPANIIKVASLLAILLFGFSCEDDNTVIIEQNFSDVVELAMATPDLSNLVAAIEKTGLTSTLQGAGPYTILAPNDAAFETFLSEKGFASLEEVPNDILTKILLNHVISGKSLASDFTTGYGISSLATGAGEANLSLYVDTSDGVKLNGSMVTFPNLEAANGIVHLVDAVIDIPTPVTFVTTNPALSSLATALTSATPNDDFVTTLSGDGPFTVLAPTDDAFAELIGRLDGFDSFEDFDTEQLQTLLATILQYHVVSGASVPSSDLTNEQVIATLQGEDLVVGIDNTAVAFIDNDIIAPANVTIADIIAGNAIIHAIDKVLIPQTAIDDLGELLISPITDIAIATPALSSLVAALVAADGDLPTTLRGEGPFTVFAPTDDAFTTFLNDNGFASLDEVPVDVLTQILLNHVVSGAAFSTDLETGYGLSSLSTAGPDDSNLSLFINTADDMVKINGVSTVASADIKATNGVVHVVDGVIGLPTVVTFATADPNFTSLVDALTTSTPSTDFVEILSRTTLENADMINPNYTVFAPTNQAFATVGTLTEDMLTSVLLHHVISESNIKSTDLITGTIIVPATLEGDTFTITLPGTGDNIGDIIDGGNNDEIGIIAVDVQAVNGVIHVLNKVMMPNTDN